MGVKGDVYRQKPVLCRILGKYKSLNREDECQREINGDELCEFYNNIFLAVVQRLNDKELENLMDGIKTDADVMG